MAKLNVRKDDTVVVTAGKYAGKQGKVLQAIPSTGRVIVEGVNIIKKHQKPTQSAPQGGIVEREAAIDASNVMPFCKKCGKGVRIAKKFLEDGTKVRTCVKCGEVFDNK